MSVTQTAERRRLETLLVLAARPCVVVMGTFDGVHQGHRELLRSAKEYATAHGLATIAVTIDPRPEQLFAPERALPNVCSIYERVARLRAAGADDVVVLPFSRAIASIDYTEFCALLTDGLGMAALFVGEDFALGSRRTGTPGAIRRLGIEVRTQTLLPNASGTAKASSTSVRQAIARGMDPDEALAAA